MNRFIWNDISFQTKRNQGGKGEKYADEHHGQDRRQSKKTGLHSRRTTITLKLQRRSPALARSISGWGFAPDDYLGMPAIIKEELDSYNPEYYQRHPIFLFKLTYGSFIRRQNHNIQKKLPIYKNI